MAKKRKKTKRMRSIMLRPHKLNGGESLLGAIKMKQNLIMGAAIGGAIGKFANKIQLPVNDTWKSIGKTAIGALVSSMDGEIVEGIGLGLVGQGTGDLLGATGLVSGADVGRLPAPQVAREKLEKNILVALEGDDSQPQEDEGEMAGAEAELRALAGAEKVVISGEEDEEEEMSGEDDEEGMSGEEYEELSGEEKKVISGLI
jgi:hypothetical protein